MVQHVSEPRDRRARETAHGPEADCRTTILSEVIGRALPYERLSLEVVRQYTGKEFVAMWESFETNEHFLDIPALHAAYPDIAWRSYRDWGMAGFLLTSLGCDLATNPASSSPHGSHKDCRHRRDRSCAPVKAPEYKKRLKRVVDTQILRQRRTTVPEGYWPETPTGAPRSSGVLVERGEDNGFEHSHCLALPVGLTGFEPATP
ncbi:hypothetical protein O159_21240 [Leifsonia xyli subsp. cynodontis DSM 46306]|uniref:Uncharacterized protein n=1 Tax=Leifsonia xyli subsp. cynodontis DSM 46306 TaxID=1389489 RepID=U3P8G4_LEIXC|nr:hypothetical protein [Leifsonia xyli]AGW42106.1 hypothetical protein O159_21240 [Leifsonia xyli subsp. cynodontis DSM 46306]